MLFIFRFSFFKRIHKAYINYKKDNRKIIKPFSLEWWKSNIISLFFYFFLAIQNPKRFFRILKNKSIKIESNILSVNETLKLLIYSDKSITRFGDGDLYLFFYRWKLWRNKEVFSGYLKLLKTNPEENNLILALPDPFNKSSEMRPNLSKETQKRNRILTQRLIKKNNTYGSSYSFRSINHYDYDNSELIKQFLLSIFKKSDEILIIEDKGSILEMTKSFSNLINKDLNSIIISIKVNEIWNFNSAQKVFKKISKLRKKNKYQTILCAYGHVSRWQAIDIINLGYRLIDLGQISIKLKD